MSLARLEDAPLRGPRPAKTTAPITVAALARAARSLCAPYPYRRRTGGYATIPPELQGGEVVPGPPPTLLEALELALAVMVSTHAPATVRSYSRRVGGLERRFPGRLLTSLTREERAGLCYNTRCLLRIVFQVAVAAGRIRAEEVP